MILLLSCGQVRAQEEEIQQLLLNVEKLAQFKQILQDMKDGYQILAQGYNTIKDLSEGNFNLHQAFLRGLLEVSPVVRQYYKVAEIIRLQRETVNGCTAATRRWRSVPILSAQEMDYLQNVYTRVGTETVQRVEDLLMILTAGWLRMSDGERIEAIDRLHEDVKRLYMFVRRFNDDMAVLYMQRTKEAKDAEVLKKLIIK
jgi:hypothetical protein